MSQNSENRLLFDGQRATWEGNTVFAPDHTVLGCYEEQPDGSYLVWNTGHRSRIGWIDPAARTISLLCRDEYCRLQKVCTSLRPPRRSFWCCAGYTRGMIYDGESGAEIAVFSGSVPGAAAAFVCLCYQARDNSPYAAFYLEWMI